MSFLSLGGVGEGLNDYFDAATAGGSGVGLGQQVTGFTVNTDALLSMAPANTQNNGAVDGFWGALGNVGNSLARIELQRYANRRTVVDVSATGQPLNVTQAAAAQAQQRQQSDNRFLFLIVAGVAAFVLLRKAA